MGERQNGATLFLDRRSFEEPLDEAFACCRKAFATAVPPVKGAEARTRAILNRLDALKRFIAEVEERTRDASFQALPGFYREGARLRGYHHLTVGPWRGIFLVDDSGLSVLGAVFSKEPHDLGIRLEELAERYRNAGANEDDDHARDDT